MDQITGVKLHLYNLNKIQHYWRLCCPSIRWCLCGVLVGLQTLKLLLPAFSLTRTIFLQIWLLGTYWAYGRRHSRWKWTIPQDMFKKSHMFFAFLNFFWSLLESPLNSSVWSALKKQTHLSQSPLKSTDSECCIWKVSNKWRRNNLEPLPTCRSRLLSTQSCPRGSSCGSKGWFRSWSRPAVRDPYAPSSLQLQSTRGLSPARSPSSAQFHEAVPNEIRRTIGLLWPVSLQCRDKDANSVEEHNRP